LVDIIDFTTIAIAVTAVIISFIVFYYNRKSEQSRLALAIIDKLDSLFIEVLKTDIAKKETPETSSEDRKRKTEKIAKKETPETSSEDRKIFIQRLGDLQMSEVFQFTEHVEFMSLLIENKEITNKTIINHFTEKFEDQLIFLRKYSSDIALALEMNLELKKHLWRKSREDSEEGRMEKLKIKLNNWAKKMKL
jgi:hypothetical protein